MALWTSCADLVTLGWELPSVTLNGEKLSIVNFLGQGGSSMVFEAQSNSGRVVIKKYLPGPNTRDIRDNEVAMLRYTAECGNITKLVDAQPMLLILKPVGVHFAVGARQTTIAHSEDNRLLITSTLICQLLDILEKLLNKFKIVHRDIKLSNIFVHNNQVMLSSHIVADLSRSCLMTLVLLSKLVKHLCSSMVHYVMLPTVY